MKERALPYGYNQRGAFARLKRKVDAMQRRDIKPSQEMLDRLAELDDWLSKNYQGWVSNFPPKQGDMRGRSK